MVKAPIGGRVKTRLARKAGLSRALAFYRHATAAVLARVGRDPRWQTLLAVAPDTAILSSAWPRHLPRLEQGGGDLGQRMQRVLDGLPPGPVAIIGSDVPGITAARVAAAFRLLGRHDAVFGPASDGGYWLVGLKRTRRIPRMFGGVRWSSADTLADSKANLAGYTVADVALLDDVDELCDLEQHGRDSSRRVRR